MRRCVQFYLTPSQLIPLHHPWIMLLTIFQQLCCCCAVCEGCLCLDCFLCGEAVEG